MADTSRPEPFSRTRSIQELRALGEAEDRAVAERGHAAWEAGDPANDEDLELELAAAGIVLDPIRYDRTSSAPPLDAIVAREITEARVQAEKAVRATHAKRPVQSKRAIVRLGPADVEILVHQRQHQAVRDTAKELGVEPEVYYRRTPDSIANCTVHCRDEWPELGDAVYSKPGDERLYSVETYLAEGVRADDLAELVPTMGDDDYLDPLGDSSELEEPLDLEELPPDFQFELHMRAPVEPLDADDPAVVQIKAAATRAEEAVRDPEVVRAYHQHLEEEFGAEIRMWHKLDTSFPRGHEAWHQAIRDECAVLDVEPGTYFLAVPGEVERCDVDCADDWPEVTTVAIPYHPGDTRLTLRTEIDDDFIDEQSLTEEVVVAESATSGRDEQADWLRRNEHTLDDDPPGTDLGSDLGCGY